MVFAPDRWMAVQVITMLHVQRINKSTRACRDPLSRRNPLNHGVAMVFYTFIGVVVNTAVRRAAVRRAVDGGRENDNLHLA